MAKIIISYRRADSAGITGRIRDRLVAHYGASLVFMDVEDIPFGSDFREHVRGELLRSDLLLVVVGREWLGKNGDGPARIHSETDPVRIEVETALQNAIPVIPVLVNGAQVPEPSDLPDTLRDFAFLNAATVDAGRDFHVHMERLIPGIDAVAAARRAGAARLTRVETTKTGGVRAGKVFAVAAALAVILLAGVGWRLISTRSSAAQYAVASAGEVAVTSALSTPGPKPAEPVQTKPVQLTRSLAGSLPPQAASPPSTSSVIAGTYLAQAKAGCGAQRQSVRVAINDGRISWEHDALDTTFRWEGTIAPDGTIKAVVADRPNLKAAGRYDLDDREVAMSYPQCGPVTMLIGQMLSR
jgi:TIR domain-containing protein